VARREKIDRGLEGRLDEFDKRVFILKIEYEKYFSGISQIEPTKERDGIKRFLRALQREHITATRQKYRVRMSRARFSQLEMYWNRNLLKLERGTHPKSKFRANLHESERRKLAKEMDQQTQQAQKPRAAPRLSTAEREDQAYRKVFDSYVKLRKKTGQSSDLQFDAVRDTLRRQVRTIKSRYRCKSVRFKVTIEDGKARVKAVPVR